MADNNDALFREVDEELARERWEKLWQQYGNYVMAGAALIVALVGGKQFWETRQRTLAEEAGAKYEAAVALGAANKPDEAAKALADLSTAAPKGYATLAKLNLAGAYLKAGKTSEALAIFEELATGAADPLLGNFARIQAASLKLGEAGYDEMQNRLTGLTVDTSPWRNAARELLARAALKAGKTDEAKALLSQVLGDATATREAAGRVTTLLATITSAELAKGAATAAPAAEATKPAADPTAAAPQPAGTPPK